MYDTGLGITRSPRPDGGREPVMTTLVAGVSSIMFVTGVYSLLGRSFLLLPMASLEMRTARPMMPCSGCAGAGATAVDADAIS